jgi:hypothetical protein
VYAAVIDEATRCKEEAWHAVRTTLTATRGPIRIIGNVKGRKNWAYTLARKAESADPNMAYFKLTAWDAVDGGILDREEIESAQQDELPEQRIPGALPGRTLGRRWQPVRNLSTSGRASPAGSEASVCWGWDLAKSVDWTVGVALNRLGETCQFERWQGPWELTIPRSESAYWEHALTGGLNRCW